uniref:Uncharacterized protein n=1 Tax=Tetranychus urticae TaxID=32264 RepID=T1KES3_TETUR
MQQGVERLLSFTNDNQCKNDNNKCTDKNERNKKNKLLLVLFNFFLPHLALDFRLLVPLIFKLLCSFS